MFVHSCGNVPKEPNQLCNDTVDLQIRTEIQVHNEIIYIENIVEMLIFTIKALLTTVSVKMKWQRAIYF